MSSFTGETKVGTNEESVTNTSSSTEFYKNQFLCSVDNKKIYGRSVQAMKDGIVKNTYSHWKGDPSCRPACRHPRVQSYDLGECAECKIRLDQQASLMIDFYFYLNCYFSLNDSL